MTKNFKKDKNNTKKYERSSEIFLRLIENKDVEDQISYRYILEGLGDRAFGLGILFFSIPSILPLSAVPGISFIFSLPIAIFSLEMMIGMKSMWLPKVLAEKKISHSRLSAIITAVLPYVAKSERVAKPRWPWMIGLIMERINGFIIFCLAILLMLPIPFSNFVFAILLFTFSLGFIEDDGLLIFIGYILFMTYLLLIYLIAFKIVDVFFLIKNAL